VRNGDNIEIGGPFAVHDVVGKTLDEDLAVGRWALDLAACAGELLEEGDRIDDGIVEFTAEAPAACSRTSAPPRRIHARPGPRCRRASPSEHVPADALPDHVPRFERHSAGLDGFDAMSDLNVPGLLRVSSGPSRLASSSARASSLRRNASAKTAAAALVMLRSYA